ncbi:hypothetical protein KSW79_04135 [Prevotella copri]|jgi:hypothetical protein|uniref:hypothetical protein n=1 Tax=Segatella copri TaxID=165179 RepID=UPI001C38CCB6|nr:hypothetical protein [Segatella copri]MBV3413594.1 hypothetical protein [Segatella copri]
MLNHNLKHHLLPSALLVAGFLTLTGCTNNDYDLNNVDATMGFGSESLVIPNSSTKEIQLKDVLDLKEGGCVVTDAAGNYLFQLAGGDVEAAYPNISPIILDVTNVFDGDISLSNAASTGAKARRAPGSSLHLASPKVMMFEYHGNDKAVKSLNEAKINENENGTEISIRLDFSNISTAVSNIESATLTLPAYLSISQVNGNSNGVPTHNGSKVTITNISTARPLELSLKTQKLDFTNNQNDHGRLSINNGAIDLTGYFSIAMQCNVTGAMPDNPTIKAKIGVADRTITMNSATGIFDPKINLNSLGEVDVTGLPDFLDDDDVVADLDNPQILLTVNNDMDVAATVSATVISTKEGRELARVTLPEMSVAKNGLSKICICRQKTSELTQQYGEANVYAVSNLSTLINRIPDHIKIVDVNAHAKPEVATIVFGKEYHVKPSYEVNAPLAFGEKANIVYEDSFTGWNDDIDKLDLAEGTYIEVTANVENKVPAYLTVKAYPVDAQGNKIEDKLLIEIPDEVAASTDGTTAVTTPITMKITPKVKNSLKQLDGLVFRLEGSAKSANGNKVTGISLNEREHTLKLNDIKVKIVGKIIGDFN